MRGLSSICFAFVIAFMGLAPARPAAAAEYPERPVTMLVGFPPGGPTDVVARVVADALRKQTGQPFIVENKAGAAGNLAAAAVAKAPANGNTILYASSGIALSPALFKQLSFDVERDFLPVSETVSIPLVLLVHPSVPAATLPEFVAFAKARPGQMNYASSGNGSITHLAAALVVQHHGVQAQHVAYKGTAPALVDLLAGNVQFTVGTINTALPYVREGKLRALAVTGLRRAATLPNVPTLDESGMKGFEATAWQGLMVPAGTPAAVVQRLQEQTALALARPDVQHALAAQDAEVRATTPAVFNAYLVSEVARWKKIIKDAGIESQ